MGTKQVLRQMEEPVKDWKKCFICGKFYNHSRWSYHIMGEYVCAWCKSRNGQAHMLIVKFVMKVAEQECMKVYQGAEPVIHLGREGKFEQTLGDPYCKLDCKCMTCTARKVLKRRDNLVNG